VPFGGFVDIVPRLGVKYPTKPQLWGLNRRFQAKRAKVLKVSCYRNYCIDFNQIWHNDRDHQVVIVDGPSRRPTNTRWRTAAILKKPVKSSYLCDRSTDCDEIWHKTHIGPRQRINRKKFEIMKIQNGGGRHAHANGCLNRSDR